MSPASSTLAGRFFTTVPLGKPVAPLHHSQNSVISLFVNKPSSNYSNLVKHLFPVENLADILTLFHSFSLSFIKVTCMLSHWSCVRLFVTPWTIARQTLLCMGFSRQEYWSGLSCTPGNLPEPGIEPKSLMSPLGGRFFTTGAT